MIKRKIFKDLLIDCRRNIRHVQTFPVFRDRAELSDANVFIAVPVGRPLQTLFTPPVRSDIRYVFRFVDIGRLRRVPYAQSYIHLRQNIQRFVVFYAAVRVKKSHLNQIDLTSERVIVITERSIIEFDPGAFFFGIIDTV